jgi:uncharacterized protein HemY
MAELGKVLLAVGLLMVLLGGVLLAAGTLSGKVPWLGRLPGDVYVKRDTWSFYFPVTTSIILSIILTLIISLIRRR